MTVGSIINLGNVEAIECLPFFHKYFYMILLATIANESYDYCLREYDGQWRSLFRIGDISHDLPDPLHDEMDSLLRLLKDDLPYAVNTRDMGVLEMGGCQEFEFSVSQSSWLWLFSIMIETSMESGLQCDSFTGTPVRLPQWTCWSGATLKRCSAVNNAEPAGEKMTQYEVKSKGKGAM
jgi:hypothetical protein